MCPMFAKKSGAVGESARRPRTLCWVMARGAGAVLGPKPERQRPTLTEFTNVRANFAIKFQIEVPRHRQKWLHVEVCDQGPNEPECHPQGLLVSPRREAETVRRKLALLEGRLRVVSRQEPHF